MVLQSFIFLLGTAALALAAPYTQTTTSANSPPLPESSAKAIFQYGDPHTHPAAVPNIVPVQPTAHPPPPRPSGITGPTVSKVKLPQAATPVVNTPGVPATGSILVGVDPSVPLATFLNETLVPNPTSNANSSITKRQSCPYPNCCPDPRYLAESTAFPYSVTGKWQNPYGSCSGNLVGPRHVLISSHCIDCTSTSAFPPPLITRSRISRERR